MDQQEKSYGQIDFEAWVAFSKSTQTWDGLAPETRPGIEVGAAAVIEEFVKRNHQSLPAGQIPLILGQPLSFQPSIAQLAELHKLLGSYIQEHLSPFGKSQKQEGLDTVNALQRRVDQLILDVGRCWQLKDRVDTQEKDIAELRKLIDRVHDKMLTKRELELVARKLCDLEGKDPDSDY